jgi:riboflavin synthase
VDGVAAVRDRVERDGDVRLTFDVPAAIRGHVVAKGSVAVDGVSLTVAAVEGDAFTVALIPHTLEITTLGERRPGDAVNVEGDVLAKYVASLLGGR